MTWEDYRRQVRSDVAEAFSEEWESDPETYGVDVEERTMDVGMLLDTLWTCDSVTGNASGSYTFNAYAAEENIAHVLFTDEFRGVISETGMTMSELFEDDWHAEHIDVAIRCHLLPDACAEFAEDWAGKHGFTVI